MSSLSFAWIAHGVLGAGTIFIILPLGVTKFRLNVLPSWTPHWVVQSIATMLLLLAGAIGLLQSSSIHSAHQVSGLLVITLCPFQTLLGHSLRALAKRMRLKAWTTAVHCIQGFCTLLLGWWTVVTGLVLASFGSTMISITALATLTEITAVIVYCTLARWKTHSPTLEKFTIDDVDEEEDDVEVGTLGAEGKGSEVSDMEEGKARL